MLVRATRKVLFTLSFIVLALVWSHHKSWTPSSVYHPLSLLKNVRPNAMENATSVQPAAEGVLKVENYPPTPTGPPWAAHTTDPYPRQKKPSKFLDMKKYMKDMLQWDRPTWEGHWPPFGDYVDKGYDPNRWEQFEM
jgi:hypothetical protein